MNPRVRALGWAAVVVSLACSPSVMALAQQNLPDLSQPGVRIPGQRRLPPAPAAGAPGAPAPAPGAAAPQAASALPVPSASPMSKLEIAQGAGGTKMVSMELYNHDIDHVLQLLSRAAGVTIVKDPEVSGNVTVIAPQEVPLDVAFQILDSILQVRGWTMVRSPTGIYKVIPVGKALQSELPLEFGSRPEDVPSSDAYLTQVIPLTNLDANDMAGQVQALLPAAAVSATSTNSLIITDTAVNIQRAMVLIAEAEMQLSGGMQVIPLHYHNAEDMADLVNALVLGRGGATAAAARPRQPYEQRAVQARAGAPAAVRPAAAGLAALAGGPEFCYPDVRTNSLVVLATPLHFQQIQHLVDQLDRPISLKDSYFLYPVQNLSAADLAQQIAPLIGATVSTVQPTAARAPAAARVQPGRQTGVLGGTGILGYGTSAGQLRTRTGTTFFPSSASPLGGNRGSGAGSIEVEPTAGTAAGSGGPEPVAVAQLPEGVVPVPPQPGPPVEVAMPQVGEPLPGPSAVGRQATIMADDNTNTLLISAAPEQIELARQLLDWLDVLPPQVHIQAIIAEITLTRDTSLGFQWESLGRIFGKFQGGTFTGDVSSNFGLLQKDDQGKVITPTGFFGQISGPEFHAVLSALTTDSHARILSTPSVFTSNNQPAQINVSSQRPFPRGTLTTTTGTTNLAVSTSIDYLSVGIVLTVTPRITQNNVVQMDVTIAADEPGAAVNIAGQEYPSVSARQLQTPSISVKDGYTIVLGGLMRDTITRTASRVPLLGDLPIVGSLFRSTSSKREKSELVVFLTPRVVRTESQAAAVTEAEKAKLLEVPRSLRGPSASAPQKGEPGS